MDDSLTTDPTTTATDTTTGDSNTTDNTTTDQTDIPTTITKNISKDDVAGKCDLKCVFNYHYQTSDNTVLTNNGTFLTLTYEQTKDSPVNFNTLQYYVHAIYIYAPSLHLYNGSACDAEIIIEHLPELTGDNLFVCLPVIASSQVTNAGITLTNIVETAATYAANVNETTTINNHVSFNLTDFVPKKPFLNYTGTQGFVGQVIIYTLMDGIPLSNSSLTLLKKIIDPATMDISGDMLFINPDGPNTAQSADGIYIDCQPTGNSPDNTDVSYKNETVNDSKFSWNNPVVHFILMGLMFILLYALISVIFNSAFKVSDDTS
jgi:hypothetical protein